MVIVVITLMMTMLMPKKMTLMTMMTPPMIAMMTMMRLTLPLPHDTDLLWLACKAIRVTTEQCEHQ